MKILVPRDLICGVCSGIPPCCIAFYLEQVALGHSIKEGSTSNPRVRRLFLKLQLRLGLNELSPYVLCPACRKSGRVVKILSCFDSTEPPFMVKRSVPCYFRDRIRLPNWGPKYGYALQDFIKIYKEGMKREKGFIVANYDD